MNSPDDTYRQEKSVQLCSKYTCHWIPNAYEIRLHSHAEANLVIKLDILLQAD